MKLIVIGGDGFGWALDEDIKTFLLGYKSIKFNNLNDDFEIIFSPWWIGLAEYGGMSLSGKKVICGLDNPFDHWLTRYGFSASLEIVGLWIVHSKSQLMYAQKLGLNAKYIPYHISKEIFYPLDRKNTNKNILNKKYKLPFNKYLIANFQRDSDGKNLDQPKIQKGPDIFIAIVKEVYKKNNNIHIVLGGPRRHWIISELNLLKIPFSYIGDISKSDDLKRNMLNREDLRDLYHSVDLCLFTSRWEGGPYGLLEAISCKTKVLSTHVGIASDILNHNCIYENISEAIDKITLDIENNVLQKYIDENYLKLNREHSEKAVSDYANLINFNNIPNLKLETVIKTKFPQKNMNKLINKVKRYFDKIKRNKQKKISIFRKFVKPPYGGGNQFMMALKKEFEKKGYKVLVNKIDKSIDAYLFDSIWFDQDLLKKLEKISNPVVVHRVDGPIYLYRGKDKNLDDQIFKINKQFATTTVVQSNFTFKKLIEAGYKIKNPIIINNAADNEIFNTKNVDIRKTNKIRLISTSWSSNPLKGEEIYKWIDENLDFERFEYKFVGNINCNFKNITKLEPVNSNELAVLLKNSDIYITASRNDPCSNALIEALSCGLPALYLNSGGHPELVGMSGLPFDDVAEIPLKLDKIVNHYEAYKKCISVCSISDIADKYLECMEIK